MSKKLVDYLKSKIQDTGYPLEIEVSGMLGTFWNVSHTQIYFDKEESKVRDIDIGAYHWFRFEDFELETELAIECKKNQTFAWVFFTIPQPKEGIEMYGNYVDELHICCKSTETTVVSDEVFDLPLHYAQVSDRLAVAFDAFNIKEKRRRYEEGKSQIFEAVYQLRKFIAYSVEQQMKEGPYGFKRFSFYFPCVVFDGKMFEAVVDGGQLKVREAPHIILQTQYRTPFSVYDRVLLVDIVHKDHFKDFLRFVRKDANIIKKKINKKKRKINQKLSEIEEVLSLQKT